VPAGALTAIFLASFVARMLAHDVVITADEDNWMRRAGGFTWGLLNGQVGRTYQNGHPGVTTMWVAMLTLGPERMVQYADRVHEQRLVGRVDGFWDALVDARPGFALATALLVTLIAGLSWRLFGPLVGALTGLLVGFEPFYLAISQLVHMDAILSGCMVASVLAALVRWTGGGRGWLVASGVLAGLAFLSKVPALFLVPFVPALGVGLLVLNAAPWFARGLGVADASAVERSLTVRVLAGDVLLWAAVLAVTYMALWPAIWVWGPVNILGRVAEFTRETGGQPHEQGTFFWGRQTADPGPLFYPVALAFRLAPLTLFGALLVPICWRRIDGRQRLLALALAAYACGFLLMMTLGAKKLDRYILPMVPALGVLAALGLAAGYGWLRDRMVAAAGAAPATMVPWKGTAAALVVVLAIWPAAATYPYYLSYYNPLLGGGPAAQRTVMVGNGEGLDQVADWLNSRPNAADLWVVSHSFDILQALIVGSGEALRDRVPSNADYVVLYRFQIQIGHSPRVLDEYLNRHTPEHVVWINGVEYARIYRGPHQAATGARPLNESAASRLIPATSDGQR
jgi:4-amino-4-deoxy-L-arabinose transferase-like glycosyltransferase